MNALLEREDGETDDCFGPDGRINLQLVNEIDVQRLTPRELTTLLKKSYSTEIDRPEIAVMVRSFSAQRVYVDGEVAKPGIITLTGPLTTLQAISQAGGLKETARENEVVLMRRGNDNKIIATMVDLSKAFNGTDHSQDVVLMPYDIVHVPRSPITNVNIWVDQYIRKNIPIGVGTSF